MAMEKTVRGGGSRRSKARLQAASPGMQPADVIAASRPPAESMEKADGGDANPPHGGCAGPGARRNGGFVNTKVGRRSGR